MLKAEGTAGPAPAMRPDKRKLPPVLRALALSALITLPAACAGGTPPAEAAAGPGSSSGSTGHAASRPGSSLATDPTRDDLAQAWQALKEATGTSCRLDNECRTLAVGWRACGGPAQYLAWSVSATDRQAMQGAARIYTALQRRRAEASGEMSTCELLPEPTAYCQAPISQAPISQAPKRAPAQAPVAAGTLKDSLHELGHCALRAGAASGLR